MKSKFEMTAALCLAIFLLAWSSYLDAQPPVDIIWGGADPGEETWTVFSATGGHMEEGDAFTVERSEEDESIKLKPLLPLRKKWGVAPDVPLTIEDMIAGDSALCGFVMLDTDEHSEEKKPYGHGQQHGILLKVQQPDRIKIMWSAFPLAKEVPNDKKTKTKKCKDLEKLHHGGVAHATNRK